MNANANRSYWSALRRQQQLGLFCDASLKPLDGEPLLVHACVLAAKSPPLAAQMEENKQRFYNIPTQLSRRLLKRLVAFLYGDTTVEDRETIEAARRFGLSRQYLRTIRNRGKKFVQATSENLICSIDTGDNPRSKNDDYELFKVNHTIPKNYSCKVRLKRVSALGLAKTAIIAGARYSSDGCSTTSKNTVENVEEETENEDTGSSNIEWGYEPEEVKEGVREIQGTENWNYIIKTSKLECDETSVSEEQGESASEADSTGTHCTDVVIPNASLCMPHIDSGAIINERDSEPDADVSLTTSPLHDKPSTDTTSEHGRLSPGSSTSPYHRIPVETQIIEQSEVTVEAGIEPTTEEQLDAPTDCVITSSHEISQTQTKLPTSIKQFPSDERVFNIRPVAEPCPVDSIVTPLFTIPYGSCTTADGDISDEYFPSESDHQSLSQYSSIVEGIPQSVSHLEGSDHQSLSQYSSMVEGIPQSQSNLEGSDHQPLSQYPSIVEDIPQSESHLEGGPTQDEMREEEHSARSPQNPPRRNMFENLFYIINPEAEQAQTASVSEGDNVLGNNQALPMSIKHDPVMPQLERIGNMRKAIDIHPSVMVVDDGEDDCLNDSSPVEYTADHFVRSENTTGIASNTIAIQRECDLAYVNNDTTSNGGPLTIATSTCTKHNVDIDVPSTRPEGIANNTLYNSSEIHQLRSKASMRKFNAFDY